MWYIPLLSSVLIIISGIGFVYKSITLSLHLSSIDQPQVLSEATSSGSTCAPPSNGCGTAGYWDSSTCTCRLYEPTPTKTPSPTPVLNICISPSGGCGSYYYWSQDTCSCKPYPTATRAPTSVPTTTPTPTSTSLSITNSPYPTSSCTYPSGGCGTFYYWDSGSCKCKQYPYTPTPTYTSSTVSPLCISPPGGCVNGYIWNSSNCSCAAPSVIPSSIQIPPATYSPSVSKIDRFAYENESRIVCVKSLLGQEAFEKLRYYVPLTSEDQEKMRQLGERVKSCWVTAGSSTVSSGGQTVRADELQSPVEKETCLIHAIGKQAYEEISSGARKATYEENRKFGSCYGKVESDAIVYTTKNEKLPDKTETCLKDVLHDMYDKVKDGQAQVSPQLQTSVDACFGLEQKPFQEAKQYKIPDTINQCLHDAVGDDRFKKISEGSTPTATEKQNADTCFQQLNKEQSAFLPLPAEQVPFIEEHPEIIRVAEIKQHATATVDKTLKPGEGAVKFSGKAPPHSTVTIYIYSEPVVVTTQADENGDWVYTLNQPLEGEKHIAYTAVRTKDGAMVRSSVFNFNVVEASERSPQQFIDSNVISKQTEQSFIRRSFVLIISTVAASVALTLLFYLVLQSRSSSSRDGKSEGETSTGAIH